MEPDNDDVRRTVLEVLGNCSKCHATYALDDARIVRRTGNLWVLAVRCSRCETQAFVAAVVGEHADDDVLERLGNESDEMAEVIDEFEEERVSTDDVLDMHEFLESFDGDFHRHFARRYH